MIMFQVNYAHYIPVCLYARVMQLSNKSWALIAAAGPPGLAGRDVGRSTCEPAL
jgi:hypothetical protein